MDDTYLFVDYGYLKLAADDTMQRVFGCQSDLNFSTIKQAAKAKRAFLYYCTPEQQIGETEAEYERRIEPTTKLFNEVSNLYAFHVRKGVLRGDGKRTRQKEIDVLIATDMLTHGFNKNMSKGILIAGDLDFRPAVEALVRNGVLVEVWYEPSTGSKDLALASDFGKQLDLRTFYNWSTGQFHKNQLFPQQVSEIVPFDVPFPRQTKNDRYKFGISRNSDGGYLLKVVHSTGLSEHYSHRDCIGKTTLDIISALVIGGVMSDNLPMREPHHHSRE